MAALFVLALKDFENLELSALNLAVQLRGNVPSENIAYNKALEKDLIQPNGAPFDLEALRDAAAFEVNRRAESGEWT